MHSFVNYLGYQVMEALWKELEDMPAQGQKAHCDNGKERLFINKE